MRLKKNSMVTFLKLRTVPYQSKYKYSQDVVYWIHVAKTQEKTLKFWQTRSHAIIAHDSVSADCIEKKWYPRMEWKLCIKGSLHLDLLHNSPKCLKLTVAVAVRHLGSTGTHVMEQNLDNSSSYNKGSTGTPVAKEENSFIPSWPQNSRSSTRCSAWRWRKNVHNARRC